MLRLIILPVALFVLLGLLVIPAAFTTRSFLNLFQIPGEIFRVMGQKALRRNHALEHATINVLEERYGRGKLAGSACEEGFRLWGFRNLGAPVLEEASRTGLARLRAGEKSLAIHDRCGTSLMTANLISSVVFLLLLWRTGLFNLAALVVTLLLANLVGPLFGRAVQGYFTVSTDVEDMEIVGVEYGPEFPGPLPLSPRWALIRTSNLRAGLRS
ncbi:MAG: hypothetical protein HYY09_06005 [Firmicutes bacterium]|nr:hypothetical protein [Bacillota bacterium]